MLVNECFMLRADSATHGQKYKLFVKFLLQAKYLETFFTERVRSCGLEQPSKRCYKIQ